MESCYLATVCPIYKGKKVKWSCYRPGVTQRVGWGIALLFHDHGTRKGWVISSTPWTHLNPGKDPVPIVQEAGWAPGPVWMGGKSRPPPGFIPTIQPVVSCYTNWATQPTLYIYIYIYICNGSTVMPQWLQFKYWVNTYPYLILRPAAQSPLFLHKVTCISEHQLFWFIKYSILHKECVKV